MVPSVNAYLSEIELFAGGDEIISVARSFSRLYGKSIEFPSLSAAVEL